MCGFSAVLLNSTVSNDCIPSLRHKLQTSLQNISHRGPDGSNLLVTNDKSALFAHARLSIIDINNGNQPLSDASGRFTIIFNGELYNHSDIRKTLNLKCTSDSDTEVILQSYIRLGPDCISYFRGMFSFVIWDNFTSTGFIARDRFGIKPLYYYQIPEGLVFSSEIKGILPFLNTRDVSLAGLADYLNFQFTLSCRTLFKGINEYPSAHYSFFRDGQLCAPICYWNIKFSTDYTHTERWFVDKLRELLCESVDLHCTSDVPIGSYVSGGIDSTLISSLSSQLRHTSSPLGFVGRYTSHEGFDESDYAKEACLHHGITCKTTTILPDDFVSSFTKLNWYLDQPVAGPGSLGQFIVSSAASSHVKVILGGQGGDEIFGGYTRYLLGYFEQCIKGAIEGTLDNGKFVVTYNSIIPNLTSLQQYIPLMQNFWSKGLFESLDKRYWSMVNKSSSFDGIVDPSFIDPSNALKSFNEIFFADGTEHASYFDRMSHFDFRTLLPALLHVEDRVSMAHGLESRVPFLDHKLVEFAATIPADVKFKNGELKRLLPLTFPDKFPKSILNRKDKMGFPIPLNSWVRDHAGVREYVGDLLSSTRAQQRFYLSKPIPVDDLLSNQGLYGRALWGLLSLEEWQRQFID